MRTTSGSADFPATSRDHDDYYRSIASRADLAKLKQELISEFRQETSKITTEVQDTATTVFRFIMATCLALILVLSGVSVALTILFRPIPPIAQKAVAPPPLPAPAHLP